MFQNCRCNTCQRDLLVREEVASRSPPQRAVWVVSAASHGVNKMEQVAKWTCDTVGTTTNCLRNDLSISQGAAYEQVTIVFLNLEQR